LEIYICDFKFRVSKCIVREKLNVRAYRYTILNELSCKKVHVNHIPRRILSGYPYKLLPYTPVNQYRNHHAIIQSVMVNTKIY